MKPKRVEIGWGKAAIAPLECPICDVDDYAGELTQAEVEGLLLALNDEYHAWAVYDQVGQDWGEVRPFTNIRRSEEQHIASLTELFVVYQVPLPQNPWPGSVPSFDSVSNACSAAVAAEIANADLYDPLLTSTSRADIIEVYQSLQQASATNHLTAFSRCAN